MIRRQEIIGLIKQTHAWDKDERSQSPGKGNNHFLHMIFQVYGTKKMLL